MQCDCAIVLLTGSREGETERAEAGMAGRTWDWTAENGPARVIHLVI